MDEVAFSLRGDGGDGTGAAEWIENDITPVAIEFNEPVDEFFREWRGMTFFGFRCVTTGARRVETF